MRHEPPKLLFIIRNNLFQTPVINCANTDICNLLWWQLMSTFTCLNYAFARHYNEHVFYKEEFSKWEWINMEGYYDISRLKHHQSVSSPSVYFFTLVFPVYVFCQKSSQFISLFLCHKYTPLNLLGHIPFFCT